MHHPPEVWLLVGRSPWPPRLLAVVGLLAVLQVSWFVLLNQTLTWQTVAVGASLLVALSFTWFWTQRPSNGSLHWDGSQWQWSGSAGGTCVLQRHLDFQTWMLVSLHFPITPPVWLWLHRAHDPYQWLALRRAIVHTTSAEQVRRANGPMPAPHTATP